jgi:hypothetical protein
MSTVAIMVLFGLLVPIFNFVGNFLCGNLSEEVKQAKKEFIHEHPIMAIIGSLISFIPAIAYWAYVFAQL